MSNTLIFYLVLHILLGTAGIILLTAYLLSVSKKEPEFKFLKLESFLAFVAFVGSWIFGGLYYTSYYGKAVKPIILKGQYPWVHKILMETKEHVFLFLPFLSLVILAVTYWKTKKLVGDKKIRLAVSGLCLTTVSIAVLILILGIVISGAVGK